MESELRKTEKRNKRRRHIGCIDLCCDGALFSERTQ